jgi:hypothetical protein
MHRGRLCYDARIHGRIVALRHDTALGFGGNDGPTQRSHATSLFFNDHQ